VLESAENHRATALSVKRTTLVLEELHTGAIILDVASDENPITHLASTPAHVSQARHCLPFVFFLIGNRDLWLPFDVLNASFSARGVEGLNDKLSACLNVFIDCIRQSQLMNYLRLHQFRRSDFFGKLPDRRV